MTVYVEDLTGGYLHPQLEMSTRELWGRDAGNLGNIKVVDSPAFSGPHSLQITTPSVAVTNLITNPSFETNTTGWSVAAQANVNALATSITRVTTDFFPTAGTAAADVVFPATLDAGARFAITGTFTSGVTYGFAIAIKSLTGATDFRVKLVSTGTPASLNSVQTITATTSWQRFNFTVTPTGTVSDVYLAITRATASAATARIDATMAYQGASVTPNHYDTTGSYFVKNTARSDQQLDLTEFDGVGIFLYSPSVTYLDTIKLRFLTQFKLDSNGDTDYTNLDGSAWFEYTIPALSGDSVIAYGGGVYGVVRYAASTQGLVDWTELIIPKSAFTVMGSSGGASWGKIMRVEIVPQNVAGGPLTVYADELSGWVQAAPEEATANRMISQLPPFMWDTDPSRQFFQIVGWEMDRVMGTVNRGLDQRFVSKADWGLDLHEAERGIPVGQPGSVVKRRQMALIPQVQMSSKMEFETDLALLADAGVRITEYPAEYRVEVVAAVNSQTDRNRLLLALNKTIPAHLQVSLSYDVFLAGQIVGSPLGPTVKTGTNESATLSDTGSQP
jgi:hypothetical protein